MICKIVLQCMWSSILAGALSAAPAASPVGLTELKKALAFYQAIERLDVDFKQVKVLKDLNLKLPSEGHLTLKVPGYVEWKILKPQALRVELDQQKITIYTASNTQTFQQSDNPSVKDRKAFESLLGWLKLDATAIADKYEIQKVDSRHYHFVARDPANSMLKTMDMEMTTTGHVAALLFTEPSGDEIHLQFGVPKVVARKNP